MSWKIVHKPTERKIEHVSIADARKFFAIDASGSTGGSPLCSEETFVHAFHGVSKDVHGDAITKWGTNCRDPVYDWDKFVWRSDMGGTQPSSILLLETALGAIHSSDIFFLLTDGEVWTEEVYNLARISQTKNIFTCPTVFFITSYKRGSPDQADVSVGITSYANCADAVCLFKDYQSRAIYVMAAKGVFAELDKAENRETWEGLTGFKDEKELINKIEELNIKVPTANTRPAGLPGLDLGPKWNAAHKDHTLVDLEKLLQAGSLEMKDVQLLFADETVDALILACKSWGKLGDLRKFFLQQKVEQVNVALEDVSGAADIIAKLGKPDLSEEEKKDLQSQLRTAHNSNRLKYQMALNDDNHGKEAKARNRLVDAAMSGLADVEKAGFTADVLSRRSNRAKRAGEVGNDAIVEISTLDFEAPAFRADCEICCGEEEIMSVALKMLTQEESAANTADFALDFPLAAGRFAANQNILSSQCICFQCALFGRPGRSMVGEEIAAVIPTLEYAGGNKMYINQQLYLALTGGLKTGVPILGQLFATILDRTLQTKVWAGAPDPSAPSGPLDREIEKRQKSLQWLLQTIVANLRVRETFNELGEWCGYPKALAWVAKDFETQGLTSWAINYPVAGFMQLIRFGTLTNVFSKDLVKEMKATKLIHSFVSTYLAKLFQEGKARAWTKDLLIMIYEEFNDDLVPRDLGAEHSVLSTVEVFWERFTKFLGAEPQLLANWEEADQVNFMPRIQILAFWLVYFQLAHTSAKTYFAKLKDTEPLSAAVLNLKATMPKNVVDEVLRSPFLQHDVFINKRIAATHTYGVIPFKSPFGASVLHCGAEGCNVSFLPQEVQGGLKTIEWTTQLVDKVRQERRQHLIEAYGVEDSFKSNQTGLPEPTTTPNKPTSNHTPLHISIARTWSRFSVEDRRAVAKAIAETNVDQLQKFLAAVCKEVCSSHRGNIYQPHLDGEVLALLPSFMTALKMAQMLRSEATDVALYEHKFEENKMDMKIKYEIKVDML